MNFTVENIINTSDERLKINIENINVPSESTIHDLKPVQYNWKRNPDGSLVFGFIAQDIIDHYPDLVKIDNNGNYSLDYIQFIPIIVRELKKQMDEIDDLTREIAYLKDMIELEIQKLNWHNNSTPK